MHGRRALKALFDMRHINRVSGLLTALSTNPLAGNAEHVALEYPVHPGLQQRGYLKPTFSA